MSLSFAATPGTPPDGGGRLAVAPPNPWPRRIAAIGLFVALEALVVAVRLWWMVWAPLLLAIFVVTPSRELPRERPKWPQPSPRWGWLMAAALLPSGLAWLAAGRSGAGEHHADLCNTAAVLAVAGYAALRRSRWARHAVLFAAIGGPLFVHHGAAYYLGLIVGGAAHNTTTRALYLGWLGLAAVLATLLFVVCIAYLEPCVPDERRTAANLFARALGPVLFAVIVVVGMSYQGRADYQKGLRVGTQPASLRAFAREKPR